MRVLDMFAGLGGWSATFHEHDVVTTDLDPRFGCTVTGDILAPDTVRQLITLGPYDVVLASPPCEGFTVMNIGKNWTGPDDDPPHQPKTDSARLAMAIVERTRTVIDLLQPRFFIIENPVAKLRKLNVVADLERRTVTYCQVGEVRRKPTDLWGGFPPSLVLPEPCRNRGGVTWTDGAGITWVIDQAGKPCHVSAPRGSRTPGSTQGIATGPARAEVPIGLSRLVLEACERDLEAGRSPEKVGLGL